MKTIRACLAALVALATPVAGQRAPVRVAVVMDQDGARAEAMVATLRRELQGFFRDDEVALVVPGCGGGSLAGIRGAIDGALRDPRIAAVVALGPIGSHILMSAGAPTKPAIAGDVFGGSPVGALTMSGSSGVPRLTYVMQSYDLERALTDFRRLVPFQRIAVVVEHRQLRTIPALERAVVAAVEKAGAVAQLVAADSVPASIVAAIPGDADAVLLMPQLQLRDDARAELLSAINARRLPTLAYANDPDVRLGALASYEPLENTQRRARRVAVNLQRILAGEDAGTLPVHLVAAPRLAINIATARTIGFSPSRTLLTNASLVGADPMLPRDTVTLADAMRMVANTNLDVIAARLEAASGEANVKLAQASLLPKLDARVSQTRTRSGTAAASFGQQPERMGEGGLSLSMPIYADRSWASYQVEARLQQGREAQRNQVRLDVVLDAGTAYVSTLRAQSLARVKRTNLERTQSNLEIARLREGVGSSSRADVFRWEGEVANARRDVIASDAQVRVAELSLNRILNRPLDRGVAQPPVTPGDAAFLLQDSTVLEWLDQPDRLTVLMRFLGGEAAAFSPELAQLDAGIAAKRRQNVSAQRAFWLPDVTLQGGLSNVFSRNGAGATGPTIPAQYEFPTTPDMSWQFKLQASYPVFNGFSRAATRAQTEIDLRRLQVQRQNTQLGVDQRVRATIEAAGASYAAIALSRAASEAAERNYELVSDAYSRGAVSITSLIDAQVAALNAEQGAANAVHDFLLDLLKLERSIGTFGVLLTPAERQAFQHRLSTIISQ